jgi:hypothetical protein
MEPIHCKYQPVRSSLGMKKMSQASRMAMCRKQTKDLWLAHWCLEITQDKEDSRMKNYDMMAERRC